MIFRIAAPTLAALTLAASTAMPLAAHANLPQPKTEATQNAVDKKIQQLADTCSLDINVMACLRFERFIEKFLPAP